MTRSCPAEARHVVSPRTAGRLVAAALLLAACGERAAAPAVAPPPPRDGGPAPAPDAAPPWSAARTDAYFARFPADELRHDAAIGLTAIRRLDPGGEALQQAWERAVARARTDHDNPLRRAYDEDFRVAPGVTTRWTAPRPGERRVNTNRVVAEAMHCDDHGLRAQSLAYATGPMRDGGGYHTTHAVWALTLARDRGCLAPAEFTAAAAPLLDELRAAQPATPPRDVAGLDLYAERALMVVLAGARDAAVAGWVEAVRAAHHADGGIGSPDDPATPTLRFHATMLARWALAAWDAPVAASAR